MYLLSHHLKNIACFEDVTLDFTDDDGEPCKWVTIVGENGTGKTTVLQTIAFALDFAGLATADQSGISLGTRFSGALVPAKLARGSDLGSFRTNIRATDGDIGSTPGSGHDYGIFDIQGDPLLPGGTYSWLQGDKVATLLHGDDVSVGWFTAGYRPGRSRFNPALWPGVDKDVGTRTVRFASLFYYDGYLPDMSEWLWDLEANVFMMEDDNKRENSRLSFELFVLAKRLRDQAQRCIVAVLPDGVEFVRVTPTKQAVFRLNSSEVEYKNLPDGYQSAIVWVADLVRRLVEAFPNSENPLHERGVVLVDEIDLHLHPSWQRKIVPILRKLFPNIQFIAATHSPFIVQDMTGNDKIISLRWDGDKVVATEDPGYVQGWRVNQILTSRLFGLSTTRGDDIELLQADQQLLLDRLGLEGGLPPLEAERLKDISNRILELKSKPNDFIEPNGNGRSHKPKNGGSARRRAVAKP